MINDDIIGKIDTLVSELNKMKEEYQARLDAKEQEVQDLLKQLKARESQLSDVEDKANTVADNILKNDLQFSELKEKVNELDSQINENKQKSEEVKKSWDDLEEAIRKQTLESVNIDEFIGRYEEFKEEQDKLTNELDKLKDKLSLLETDYEKAMSNKSEIEIAQNSAKETIATLKERIDACDELLKMVNSSVKTLDTYIKDSLKIELRNEFAKTQSEIACDLQKVKDYIVETTPVVSKIDEKIKIFNETELKANEFDTRLEEYKATIEQFGKDLWTFGTKIKNVDDKIAELAATVNASQEKQNEVLAKWDEVLKQFYSWFDNEGKVKDLVIKTVLENIAYKSFGNKKDLVLKVEQK